MYDLCIIGAGWAGFSAASRASILGKKVILIEEDELGGVCLNRGCIPTKVLLNSTKFFNKIKRSSVFGIDVKDYAFDFKKITDRKNNVIKRLKNGLEYLIKTKKINFIKARARIIGPQEVEINSSDNIKSNNIIIASGSRPKELFSFAFDGKKIISSDELLKIDSPPKKLLIIGGGVIGCEFAEIFLSFGSQVSIIELTDQILPSEDKEIAKKLEIILKRRGAEIFTNTDPASIDTSSFTHILVSVGRTYYTQDLGLEGLNILKEGGRIVVDDYLKTNIPNIYAIGDCIGGKLLAHKAAYEGNLVVNNIFNNPEKIDYQSIPSCVFTDPEIASIGVNEDKLKQEKFDFNINRFNFLGVGAAHILDETEGFIKILSDKKTGEILGATIFGPHATELINILSLAVKSKIKISQIAKAIFSHPTLSEIISEAAYAM